MTRFHLVIAAALVVTTGQGMAAGDAEKGAQTFKKCQTCHTIADADGKKIAGNGAKVGPNLYGVMGRKAGSYEGFNYGDSMVAAGEKGLVWDETQVATYVQDPTAFLKDYLGDPKARGKMTFKLTKQDEADNVAAFLKSVGPAEGAAPSN